MEPVLGMSYYLEVQRRMSAELFQQPHYQWPTGKDQRPSANDSSPDCFESVEDWITQTPDEDGASMIDQQRALVDAAEEMRFDWPKLLPVERIQEGLTEIALCLFLVVGLVAAGGLYFLSITA
jgi:hypothetical protein